MKLVSRTFIAMFKNSLHLRVQPDTLIGIVCIVLYWLPVIIMGESSYLPIHDSMDVHFSTYKIIGQWKYWFASNDTIVSEVLGGVPRAFFPSEFNIVLLLFSVLSPINAYTSMVLITSLLAFFSFRYFLRAFSLNEKDKVLASIVSCCFAVLPHYPFGAATVALFPFVIGYFYKNKGKPIPVNETICLFMVPLYSSFVGGGLFVSIIVLISFLTSIVRMKKIEDFKLYRIFIVLNVIYLITEWRLLSSMLFGNYVTHRSEFFPTFVSLKTTIELALFNFLNGHYHVATFHKYIVLPVVALGVLISFFRKRWIVPFIFFFIGFFSIVYGVWKWEGLANLKENFFLFRILNFSRFHWFHPVLWYGGFYFSLVLIRQLLPRFKNIVLLITFGQLCFLFYNADFCKEYRSNKIAYKTFFCENAFSQFKSEMNLEYRVISIGIHPSIAAFNGLKTLDYYHYNYPLITKKLIYKIQRKELSKNKKMEKYFVNWGSRAYIFSSVIGINFLGQYEGSGLDLLLDWELLKENKVKYIISKAPILNLGKAISEYNKPDAAWHLYLYEL